ncbi:MAG: malectin domain-containing carbohydrate-binding protein [Geobacteraceae bacterium]|nr:malectin domain-containing carbohydrate-binding protein [Geobacteraceae bacterium]
MFIITATLLLSSAMSAYSAQATLSWDAVNDPGVAGYKLYYGSAPGSYTNSVDTGKTTSVTVNDLADGNTYYFVSTAYDSAGTQSGYSNEVNKSVPSSTQYSLLIGQNGTGTGTVTGSGIDCGSVCTNAYAPGTVVTLAATPASGSAFAGWSGGGCSGTGTCTVTMNASTSITATFNSSAVTYDITATASGNGTITALNNTNVSQGTSGLSTVSIVNVTQNANQQFSITPETGNYTASVSVDGSVVATNLGSYTYTFSNVTANHTILATFTPSAGESGSSVLFAANAGGSQYTSSSEGVTYLADTNYSGGNTSNTTATISGTTDGTLYQGERFGNFSYNVPVTNGNYSVTLKFAEIYWSAPGQRVFSVNVNGKTVLSNLDLYATVGKYTAYDVVIPVSVTNGAINIDFISKVDNAKISAVEVAPSANNSYNITAAAGTGGSITPIGATTVNSGSSQSFTITPDSGYQIADVQVDGASVGAVSTYVFSSVTSNHTISVTFTATTSSYTVTASAASGGSISPAGTVSVSEGASKSFTITPNAGGYYTASVSVDGSVVATNLGSYTYTFSSVAANHTIGATFAVNTYSIIPSAGSGGSISPTTALINYGESQSFSITPNSGYAVADVKVDGTSVGAVTSYTFSNVTANHTISASFTTTSSTYTIVATAASGGSISPAGTVAISGGASKTFTMVPRNRYQVSDVQVDGVSKGAISSYTFSNVAGNHTIKAFFSKK